MMNLRKKFKVRCDSITLPPKGQGIKGAILEARLNPPRGTLCNLIDETMRHVAISFVKRFLSY